MTTDIFHDPKGLTIQALVNPVEAEGVVYRVSYGSLLQEITFQHGPFLQDRITGITDEAVVRMLIHRFETKERKFQQPQNAVILHHLNALKDLVSYEEIYFR